MGRICAWCSSVVTRVSAGRNVPMTHVLCAGCLEELREQLAVADLERAGRDVDA
jgi:hypothetical protein